MADIKSLLEEYDKKYGQSAQQTDVTQTGGNTTPEEQDLSAYLDQFKSTPTQPEQQQGTGFDLKGLLSGVASGAKNIVTDPLETIKSLARGVQSGTLETVANIGLVENAILNRVGTVLPEGLRNILDLNETGKQRGEELVNQMFEKAKQLEEESAKAGSGQKFIHDIAEFIPSSAAVELSGVPTLASKLGIAQKIPGLTRAGARFLAETQLIYNPQADGSGRIQSGAENFLAGMAFHVAPNLIKKISEPVVRPMKKLADSIFNKFNQTITEDTYRRIMPAILGTEDPNKITITKDIIADAIDVLKGKKPITAETRLFFSSPEWKNVVKKYGIDLKKYPYQITLEKPPESVIYPGKVSGLLKGADTINSFVDDVSNMIIKIADSNDFNSAKDEAQRVFESLDLIRSLGYDIPEKDFVELVRKGVDYAKRYNESMTLLLDAEAKKEWIDSIKNYSVSKTGYDLFGLIQKVKRTYSLIRRRAQEPIQSIINSFEKDRNFGGWDAYGEAFGEMGLLPRGGMISPSELISFILDFPTYKSVKEEIAYAKSLQPKEAFDFKKEVYNLLKPKRKIETPRLVVRPTFKDSVERLAEQKKLPPNINTVIESAKSVVASTVDDRLANSAGDFITDSGIVWYKVSDETVPIEEVAPTLGRYAKSLIEQIRTIGELPKEQTEVNSNIIVRGLNTIQRLIYKTPFIESLFSAQNKALFSETNRLGSMLLLLERSLEPVRILQQRVDSELERLLRPETKLLFNEIIEKQNFKNLTPDELRAVNIWQSYAKSIYEFINVLRVEAGRKPLPEVKNYFPRQLADVLKEHVEQFTKETGSLINVDSSFLLKRTLDTITTLHEKDINKILPVYHRSVVFYTDSLLRQITKDTVRKWSDEEYSAFVERLRKIGYFPSLEKEYEQMMTSGTQWLARNAKKFFDKVTLGKFQNKVKIPDELKEALKNSSLINEPAVKDFLEKEYIDISKDKWGKIATTITSTPIFLSSTLKLILNIPFTILNMMQAGQMTLKTFGISALPSVVKGYYHGTFLPFIYKMFGREYMTEEGAMLKSLGYLSARYGVYGEGLTLLDYLGKFGDVLTANIVLTEKAQRLSATFAVEDILKKIPELTPKQRMRIAAEFSAFFNFIGGKYANPSIRSSLLGKAAYQFMQYPMSSFSLSLEMYKNIATKDPVAKKMFLNIVRATGDKDAIKIIEQNINKLTPSQLDNLMGILASMGATFGGVLALFNIFNIAAGFITNTQPYISFKRAKEEAVQVGVPALSVIDRLGTGGISIKEDYTNTTLKVPGTPALTMILSVPKMGEAIGKFTHGLINDNINEMDKAIKDMNDVMLTILPTFVQRLQDIIDASREGVVYNTKDTTKKQYELSKKPVESPLSLLFGRSTLKQYEQYGKVIKEVENKKDINQQASEVFIKALIEKDPQKKKRYMNLYYKLVRSGAKRVKTKDILRTIRKRKSTTALDRMLLQLSKKDRYKILQSLKNK